MSQRKRKVGKLELLAYDMQTRYKLKANELQAHEQDLMPGRIVCSIAGRDRGHIYVVQAFEQASHGQAGCVCLVNGSTHPWAKPKPKNPKHVRIIRTEQLALPKPAERRHIWETLCGQHDEASRNLYLWDTLCEVAQASNAQHQYEEPRSGEGSEESSYNTEGVV